ncbi:MAG: Glutamyl-tRNA(Gln) amidotransferase subunit C [Candidatus Omnitrophica bacterium]|nr:Glutamyl-tRNA(Gln) amidotransferase subunit C [Candidatus Omnitrophota bacterium]
MSSFDLRHVARLARLHFTDAELKPFESQLSKILGFVEELKEVNVDGVEPTSHPLAVANVFRADEPVQSLDVEPFLARAPKARGRFFEVPKIIEDRS